LRVIASFSDFGLEESEEGRFESIFVGEYCIGWFTRLGGWSSRVLGGMELKFDG